MKTECFDFDLPEASIALRPVSPRDSAKMLQVQDGQITDHHVFDLPDLLRFGDVLVLNDTRVLPAALTAVRSAREQGGGGDVTLDVNLHKQTDAQTWRAFIRPAKRVRPDDVLHFSSGLQATVTDKRDGGDVTLVFSKSGDALLAEFEDIGVPPLPPYIARKRAPEPSDADNYQTVYANETGSVAAPTAGLHFTPALLKALTDKGVQIETVLLHVGAGTFLPVKTDDTDFHEMHSEWRTITPETAARINAAKTEGRRIIAVGTTALRALESSSREGVLHAETGDTDIFITPGYKFQMIDGLMTNFHLPRSTLFMLVSALAGLPVMQAAYAHAVAQGYRFYSYGDSSLLWAA